MPAVGIVDADVLPTIEKLSPAAPSTFMAALVLLFCFEACLNRGMAHPPSLGKSALGEPARKLPLLANATLLIEFRSSS
jgi:hypothetical protein